MDNIVEMRASVRGRVQGVFFRAVTQEHAERLGLVGTVQNKPDGSVEIVAQGKKELLEALMTYLRSQDGPGHVEEAEIRFLDPHHIYEQFSILH